MEQAFDVLFLMAFVSIYAFIGGVYYERKHNEREYKRFRRDR